MPDVDLTDVGGELRFAAHGRTLARYVYSGNVPQLEAPRPYAMLRTPGGLEVCGYRPADHVWHRGLSLALPNVGPHNFWGGPTYVRGRGYVQLDNVGSQRHDAFELSADGVVEWLTWLGADGGRVLTERRTLAARVLGDDAWALTWRSELTSVSEAPLALGSPTTQGRPDAGYAGVFWRGPVSFSGGAILAREGAVGEAARGLPHEWLAFVAPDVDAGLLMVDESRRPSSPWFVRSDEYAGLGPAPFFHEETLLGPGERLRLGAVVVAADGDPTVHAPAALALREDIAAD